MKPRVRAEMVAALAAAKQYRGEFPRQTARKGIDAMVRNALDQDIPE